MDIIDIICSDNKLFCSKEGFERSQYVQCKDFISKYFNSSKSYFGRVNCNIRNYFISYFDWNDNEQTRRKSPWFINELYSEMSVLRSHLQAVENMTIASEKIISDKNRQGLLRNRIASRGERQNFRRKGTYFFILITVHTFYNCTGNCRWT